MDALGHICKTLDEIEQIINEAPTRLFLFNIGVAWKNGVTDYENQLIESFKLSIAIG